MIAGIHIPLLYDGRLGVDVFIILSGFVIGLLRLSKPEPYADYLFRRFMRLYPLFLIALVLGIFTAWLYPLVLGQVTDDGSSGTFAIRHYNERQYFWQYVITHLTMLHGLIPNNILPQAAVTFSGPLWSISLEWQFYIVAPLLVWCLNWKEVNRWRWMLLAALFIVLGTKLAVMFWPNNEVPAFLPQRLELFAIGILCAVGWEDMRTMAFEKKLLLLVLYVLFSPFNFPVALWLTVYMMASINSVHRITSSFHQLMGSKITRWLGERSYGLYVLHMPILLLVAHYCVMPYRESLGKWGAALVLVAISLPLVLLLAALCYQFIEQPTIRWAKQVVDNKNQRSERPDMLATT